MNDLIERVLEYSKNNPNGFTLNIENFKEVKFGIIVAYKETQNSFTKRSRGFARLRPQNLKFTNKKYT